MEKEKEKKIRKGKYFFYGGEEKWRRKSWKIFLEKENIFLAEDILRASIRGLSVPNN